MQINGPREWGMSRGRQVHRAFSLFTLLHQSPKRVRAHNVHAQINAHTRLCLVGVPPLPISRTLRYNGASCGESPLPLAFVDGSRLMRESVNHDAVSYRDRILRPVLCARASVQARGGLSSAGAQSRFSIIKTRQKKKIIFVATIRKIASATKF